MKQYIEVLNKRVYGKTGMGIILFLQEQIRDRPVLTSQGYFTGGKTCYFNRREVANGTIIYTPTLTNEKNTINIDSIFTLEGSYGRRFISKNPQWFKTVEGDRPKEAYRFYLNSKLYEFLQESGDLEIKH
jgi:hypothetical protein